MMSTTSSSSFLSTLKKRLPEQWWMALIMGLCMLLVGPVLTYFNLYTNKLNMLNSADFIAQGHEWLNLSAYFGYYFLAIIFGIVCGIVYTDYQHHRRQADLYHSLPIRRHRLFATDVCTGIMTFGVLLTITMLLIAFIALALIPLRQAVWVWLAIHFVQILLVFATSLGITLLAGQLTGHVLGHLEMALLLHFGVTILGITLNALMSFYETFVNNDFIGRLMSFSLIGLISTGGRLLGDQRPDTLTAFSPLFHSGEWIALLSVMILTYILAYRLTLRRPSERAGQTFIYPVAAWPVKAYAVIIGAGLAGLAASKITNTDMLSFVITAAIAAALVHIVFSIAYYRNVRQIGKGWISTGVFFLIAVSAFTLVHFDATGFNDKQPATENIEKIHLDSRNINATIQDEKDIARVQAFIQEVKAKRIDVKGDTGPLPDYDEFTVSWGLKNGKTMARHYAVPHKDFLAAYQKIYHHIGIRRALYPEVFDPAVSQKVVRIETVLPSEGLDGSENADNPFILYAKDDKKNDNIEYRDNLFQALQRDIEHRNIKDQATNPVAILLLQQENYRNYGVEPKRILVFPTDIHTISLLTSIEQEKKSDLIKTTEEVRADIQEVTLYKVNENTGNTERILYQTKDPKQIAQILDKDSLTGERLMYPGVQGTPNILIVASGDGIHFERGLMAGRLSQYTS